MLLSKCQVHERSLVLLRSTCGAGPQLPLLLAGWMAGLRGQLFASAHRSGSTVSRRHYTHPARHTPGRRLAHIDSAAAVAAIGCTVPVTVV
jgi:hypothetical protein